MASTTTEPFVKDLEFRGVILGLTIKDKSTGQALCHYFGGIPYAQPPVGEHRWRRPRELAPCYRYGTAGAPGVFDTKCDVCPQSGRADAASTSEDCLQCNVWVPVGDAPPDGWPVYFFIHGGFLQVGNANSGDPVKFVSEVAQCIVVRPGYRLNVFGFLSGEEVAGNFGFWDLRLALEWTYKNINYLGGNPRNITVGGYSAGAHAAFYQLAFDLEQPTGKRLIRRLVMHSNGPSVQPKSYQESQVQFDELLQACGISKSDPNKLSVLKQKPAEELVQAIRQLRIHQFRAVTDNAFIRSDLFSQIADGTFGRKMVDNNVQLLIGECADEHYVYAHYLTPQPGLDALHARFEADYPRAFLTPLLRFYFPTGQLPPPWLSWREAFGRVYANLQIHVAQRGLVSGLVRGGAAALVHRYRIEWRACCADKLAPRAYGATHMADMPIWWFGDGLELELGEQALVRRALLDGFARFIAGGSLGWEAKAPHQIRCLTREGRVETVEDTAWDSSLEVWRTIGSGIAADSKPRL